MTPRAPEPRRGAFILLYALAWAGGSVAYIPLLTVLLPGKVAALAGAEAGVGWLAQIALAGALTASLGNVGFGYLSDITGNRRGWILAGLVLSAALLPLIGKAQSLNAIIMAVVAWQLALNMMLGPLAAWAGDRVADSEKGLLGGMMAFAPGAGALAGAVITQPGLFATGWQMPVIGLIVAACVLPALALGGAGRADAAETEEDAAPARSRRAVVQMWLARLSIQVAEATLFAYLLFWLRSLDQGIGENGTARLFFVIMALSVPVALAAGRWSDRQDRPLVPLVGSALLSSCGLFIMALVKTPAAAMLAYGLFGLASAVFLSLHSAQTLRVLPRPARRGRDLGLFNLTNTLPSLIMPWLAIALVPVFGFQALFAILGALALGAALLLATIARAT